MSETAYEGWTILELMGHRRLAGYVREVTVAGAGFLRLDIPGEKPGDPPYATQFIPPSSLYCLTPTTEEIARQVARSSRPEPVARWELKALPASAGAIDVDDGHDDHLDDDDDDEDLGDDDVEERRA